MFASIRYSFLYFSFRNLDPSKKFALFGSCSVPIRSTRIPSEGGAVGRVQVCAEAAGPVCVPIVLRVCSEDRGRTSRVEQTRDVIVD